MSEPLVCCVMLTRDRPEMARRAVKCFGEQTYPFARRMLVILDTGNPSWLEIETGIYLKCEPDVGRSIGALRNIANGIFAGADILIHWDDDDWSHPNRIAEQVAFLQQSGADAVGYREMLFWRTPKGHEINCEALDGYADDCTCGATGEAWLYSNPHPRYCLGTSLCYWRSAWERNPFPDTSKGEEGQPLLGWQSKLNCASLNVMTMIASIHGSNTCSAIDTKSPFWKRAPEWDEYCRERMAL